MAHYLGESIRQAIAGEHLPVKLSPGHIPPPHDPGLCKCGNRINNYCSRRILDMAFKVYADNYPERFPVF